MATLNKIAADYVRFMSQQSRNNNDQLLSGNFRVAVPLGSNCERLIPSIGFL